MGDFGITLGPVHVATPAGGASRIVASSDTPVTVGGQTTFYIPAGASVVTDPLPWPAVAGSSIDVSIYIAADTISLTAHQFAMATGFYASGNQVGLATLTSPVQTSSRIILSGVDVLGGSTSGTIATLGDSITDGFRSTYDKNHRWPDYLVVRLQKTAIVNALGVVNAGITGNALLSNQIGINAAARLPNDVLALPNLRYLCVLEGANDIASANASSASAIAAYQQIIDKAHELGVKVIFGTITPFYNAGISNPGAKEAVREAVNAWIRAGVGFDGFIDFDAAIRDPKNPLIINPIYDSGDHAHPNDAGYAAMAQAVNLALFGATSNAASALDDKPPSRVRKQ
jgi:lysophospholipase L1-like esterase